MTRIKGTIHTIIKTGNKSLTSAAATEATVLNPFSQKILAVRLLTYVISARARRSGFAPTQSSAFLPTHISHSYFPPLFHSLLQHEYTYQPSSDPNNVPAPPLEPPTLSSHKTSPCQPQTHDTSAPDFG
jgi:hypothetical protein